MKKRIGLFVVVLVVLAVTGLTANAQNLLFLSHYDGNTDHGGRDADIAVGSDDVLSNGGVISATSKFGAGSLDPSGNSVGNNTPYDVAGNFNVDAGTVDMWVKMDDWADTAEAIDTNGAHFLSIWNTPSWWGAIYMRNVDGKLSFAVSHDPGGASYYDYETSVLNVDTDWHHVAFEWDFTAGQIAVYLDGVSQALSLNPASNAAIAPYNGTWGAPFEIGTLQGGYNPLPGLVDEVRIMDGPAYGFQDFAPETAPYIPEPATLALLGLGGLFARRRFRKS